MIPAIYHLEAKVITRGVGRSAVAASAYMSCSEITNEYDGVKHDYTRKGGLVYEKIFLPAHAPPEWCDRSTLWNAVEEAEKTRDSRLAREFIVALPVEVSRERQIAETEEFAKALVNDGMCVDVCIHDTGEGNPHTHIMATVRPLSSDGTWQRKTEKEYLCIRGGKEQGFTASEFLCAKNESWEKQYQYYVDGKKVYLPPSKAEGYERVNKYPKSTKYGRQNPISECWNSDEQLFEWRKLWADIVNRDLEEKNIEPIFDKYTTEGYGAHRITTWLNNNGYRARTGKMWHEATIRGILRNLTYTGVLRSGESRSEIIPELQIISPEQYERARMIMQERSDRKKENPAIPLNTKGKSLISGKVYCGHCGSRLNLTTSGRYRKRKDGSVDTTKRIRYACYGKSRKQTECDGQSGYTMHILDYLIDEIVRNIFRKMKGVSKSDVVKFRYADELEVRKNKLNMVKADYNKEFENLAILKAEVIKAIKGESPFSADTLSELIAESEKECGRLFDLCADAEKDVVDGESVLRTLSDSFDELISWAELYDEASFEKKKMIVNCLIKRVEVCRGYKLKVEFNIDIEQFMVGIDKVA